MQYVYVCNEQPERRLGNPSTWCESGGWVEAQTLIVEAAEFELSQLDPEVTALMFGSGFVLVGTAFVIGRSVKALLDMFK